jgi:purine-cytosine permease-like protein
MATARSLSERLDALNEYDREPVPENTLQGPTNFAGIYAGEHVAGTEFVIGPLFVAHGVAAFDLMAGLLIGNLLAVLSWGFICAPIATRTRLNQYWQLRRVVGPGLLVVYNIVNALMFCFLAGSMISVAATAVGLPFDMPMPGLSDFYPTSMAWVYTVMGVGAVVTVVAILGFEKMARFSTFAAPVLFAVFVYSGVTSLPKLGMDGWGDFWRVANEVIWTGIPLEGRTPFTFWHVMFFAWFANAAMHLGMADMTILRYAKKWQYGFFSAFGMYLGHFVAWIASGILVALAMQQGGDVAPGPIAMLGAGAVGLLTVVIAGWTTANPTIYRAGLALQTITPNWKRWKVTAFVGALTTVAALFPALMMRLLDFVALYGLLLVPMGGVLLADYWMLPRLGLSRHGAERYQWMVSVPALVSWIGALVVAFLLNHLGSLALFFLGLPAWITAMVLYVALRYAQARRSPEATAIPRRS